VSITMNIVLDLMKKGSLLEFNLILKREIKWMMILNMELKGIRLMNLKLTIGLMPMANLLNL
jgi:hypothetical protein